MHIPENLLATFLIVIHFTPFPFATGVTLKKIRIENIPLKFGSITTSTPAFLYHGAVTGQFFQSNSRNPVPTNPEPLINKSHWFPTEEPALCDMPVGHYSTKVGATTITFLRSVHSPPKAVIQQRSCLGKRGAEILVLFQPAFNARNVHIPLFYLLRLEKADQRIEFLQIILMNHGGYGDLNPRFMEVIDGHQSFSEGASTPERFMSLLHSIEAHLDLVHLKPLCHLFRNQGTVGEKHASKIVIPQKIVHPPELRMKQGFPAREKKTKPLNFLKFLQGAQHLLKGEVLMSALPKVAMTTLKIAAIGQLKFEVPK